MTTILNLPDELLFMICEKLSNVVDIVNDDSYVTNYSVSYKDSKTQKWVYYNEFEGNINSYTSKINPVNNLLFSHIPLYSLVLK